MTESDQPKTPLDPAPKPTLPECGIQYTHPGPRDPGERIVRCDLPFTHDGDHEETETGVTWPRPQPAPAPEPATSGVAEYPNGTVLLWPGTAARFGLALARLDEVAAVANVRCEPDERWYTLTAGQLGILLPRLRSWTQVLANDWHRDGDTYPLSQAIPLVPAEQLADAQDLHARVLQRLKKTQAELAKAEQRLGAYHVTGSEADELRRRRIDDLEVRGILKPDPSAGVDAVPMTLGDTIAPAIRWLVNDRDRLVREKCALSDDAAAARHELAEAFRKAATAATNARYGQANHQSAPGSLTEHVAQELVDTLKAGETVTTERLVDVFGELLAETRGLAIRLAESDRLRDQLAREFAAARQDSATGSLTEGRLEAIERRATSTHDWLRRDQRAQTGDDWLPLMVRRHFEDDMPRLSHEVRWLHGERIRRANQPPKLPSGYLDAETVQAIMDAHQRVHVWVNAVWRQLADAIQPALPRQAAPGSDATREADRVALRALTPAVLAALRCIPDGEIRQGCRIHDGATVRQNLRRAYLALRDGLGEVPVAASQQPDAEETDRG